MTAQTPAGAKIAVGTGPCRRHSIAIEGKVHNSPEASGQTQYDHLSDNCHMCALSCTLCKEVAEKYGSPEAGSAELVGWKTRLKRRS